MNTTLYFILNDWDDDENHYWEQFSEFEDAVKASDDFSEPKEIFKADLKSIGFYKTKTSIVKAKKPKGK